MTISDLAGQGRGTPAPSSKKDSSSAPLNLEMAEVDTSFYYYFTLEDINTKNEIEEENIHHKHNYSESRQFKNPHLSLGNYGSSLLPVIYSINKDIGNRLAFNQYDAYHQSSSDFRYFQLNLPYNNLYFSPVGGQRNFLVKADFSRNFTNQNNINLAYKRINQVGFYSNQDTKITSFAIGLWNKSKNGKRNSFISLHANNNEENHNGGVRDSIGSDNISRTRTTIPTLLDNDAVSRFENFKYVLDNFLSYGTFNIHHQISFHHGYYKYSDDGTLGEEEERVYGKYLTETRGLRAFYGFSHLENELSIGFEKNKYKLDAGLAFANRSFDLETEVVKKNDAFLYGKLKTDFGIVQLDALLKSGFLDAAGNFLLTADANIPLGNWIHLFGNLSISRYNPAINHQKLILNHLDFFNNDNFSKVNESSLNIGMTIPKTKTSFSWTSTVSDNLIYMNSDLDFVQNEGSILGTHFMIHQELNWKIFHFDNGVHYQTFDNNWSNLPELYSRHDFYVQGKLFKQRLLLDVGTAMINIVQDKTIGYLPITGSFYAKDNEQPYYPYTELYVNFKVDDFTGFIKAENLSFFFRDDFYYHIDNYPQFDYKLRIGVNWFLKN